MDYVGSTVVLVVLAAAAVNGPGIAAILVTGGLISVVEDFAGSSLDSAGAVFFSSCTELSTDFCSSSSGFFDSEANGGALVVSVGSGFGFLVLAIIAISGVRDPGLTPPDLG